MGSYINRKFSSLAHRVLDLDNQNKPRELQKYIYSIKILLFPLSTTHDVLMFSTVFPFSLFIHLFPSFFPLLCIVICGLSTKEYVTVGGRTATNEEKALPEAGRGEPGELLLDVVVRLRLQPKFLNIER